MAEEYIRDTSSEPRKRGEKIPEVKSGEEPKKELKPVEKSEPKSQPEPEPIPAVKPEPKSEEKPESEPKPEIKPEEEKVPVSVQDRIDRMYARLKNEQRRNVELSAISKAKEISEEEDEGIEEPKSFTANDAEAIWDRKEKEKRFLESETKVLLRHPDALNENGSFNMNSEFTKKYIEVGRRNPMLAMMENGPELAEAMVEKESGISYKQGKRDEAARGRQVDAAHTSSSTVAVPATEVVKISDVQHRIAARMGLTDKEYLAEREKINKGQRSI